MKNIKAVIFDLDGVITETSNLHTAAWQKMAEEEKMPFDEEIADQLRGVSRRQSLELILEHAKIKYGFHKEPDFEEFDKLMNRKNNYYVESLSSITSNNLLPGAIETVNYLKEKECKIAIGSSSKNAKLVIENLGISYLFDAVVDGTEITFSKPHPEIFQKAADKLDIFYEQCAVVEDAASGVQAANKAGMFSIGIGPEDRFLNKEQKPDVRFDDTQEFCDKKEELFYELLTQK